MPQHKVRARKLSNHTSCQSCSQATDHKNMHSTLRLLGEDFARYHDDYELKVSSGMSIERCSCNYILCNEISIPPQEEVYFGRFSIRSLIYTPEVLLPIGTSQDQGNQVAAESSVGTVQSCWYAANVGQSGPAESHTLESNFFCYDENNSLHAALSSYEKRPSKLSENSFGDSAFASNEFENPMRLQNERSNSDANPSITLDRHFDNFNQFNEMKKSQGVQASCRNELSLQHTNQHAHDATYQNLERGCTDFGSGKNEHQRQEIGLNPTSEYFDRLDETLLKRGGPADGASNKCLKHKQHSKEKFRSMIKFSTLASRKLMTKNEVFDKTETVVESAKTSPEMRSEENWLINCSEVSRYLAGETAARPLTILLV